MLLVSDLVNRFVASAYAFQQLLIALLRYGYRDSGVDWLCIKQTVEILLPELRGEFQDHAGIGRHPDVAGIRSRQNHARG